MEFARGTANLSAADAAATEPTRRHAREQILSQVWHLEPSGDVLYWDVSYDAVEPYPRMHAILKTKRCRIEKWGWRERETNVELNSEIWENGVCDIWEKWGWRERKFVFFELKSEIWQKGVCDIWEKWVCLGVRKGDP